MAVRDSGEDRSKGAASWLLLKNHWANVLETGAEAIAERVIGYPGGNPGASWVREAGQQIKAAELLVWESAQWEIVLNSLAPFEGAPCPIPERPQVWTWPEIAAMSPETCVRNQFPPGSGLAGLLLLPCSPPPANLEPVLAPAWPSIRIINIIFPAIDEAITEQRPFLPYLAYFKRNQDRRSEGAWVAVTAAMAFLAERIFVAQPLSLSRQERRQYDRKGTPLEGDVSVIQLRRQEPLPAPDGAAPTDCASRDWANRWWVGGHWRQRSERWTCGDGPIWVRAHLKGPEEKPVKNRVVHVNR